MNNESLVSIIMAAYNAETYIHEAIESALLQSHKTLELLIINDGSSDLTEREILKFEDTRIKYFKQENRGVSAARNIGLDNMKGDFFCFLDADDRMPPNSLSSRLVVFRNSREVDFVDGIVKKMDSQMLEERDEWVPDLKGKLFYDLIKLSGGSFAVPSWLIKRDRTRKYEFENALTHCEDLLFFMELSHYGGGYAYVNEPILFYRNTPGSAMKDIKALERGYRFIEKKVKNWYDVPWVVKKNYQFKWRYFILKDYLKRGHIRDLLNLIK